MNESSPAAGARVGPYEILSLLGKGGMGAVYKARDLRLSREVALKIVRSDIPAGKESLHRFADEARAASLLSHPNIVAVYDIGDRDGSPYIISELLEGETLRDRLSTGPLPARRAVEYGIQVLRGLAAAHEKGIVHRDLKPENLFLTKDGLVKILDFGIAKLGRRGEEPADTDVETRSHTTPGTMMGTVGYMSPEQVRGLAVDHRSDLFSFGAVLYEMLTGKRAFKGTTVADTLSAILREDPAEASGNGPELPIGLVRVVRRSLEKRPEDRFQNARDLAFALEGGVADTRATTTESHPVWPGFRRWRAVAVVSALVAIGSSLGAWFGRALAPVPALPSFQRLTFRPGQVPSARFTRDGETIVYSARWGNNPIELFSTRATTRGELSLGIRDALILSISGEGKMALLLKPRLVSWGVSEGRLAIAPIAGGPPREVLEGVLSADWSPDGKDLAVVHVVEEDKYRIEYPIGHVLYAPDPPAWISQMRISPKGDFLAFLEHPVPGDKQGSISIVDDKGRKRTLASGLPSLDSLGWPNEGEIWFNTSAVNGTPNQIRSVTLSGRQRLVEETPDLPLLDVSRRGQILGVRQAAWTEIRARAHGATEEVELPAADLAYISDLSDDGRLVLGTDIGENAGPNFRFYVQRTDGSPALWLGEGDGQALSPDGTLALAVLEHTQPQQLIIVPTGAGETRTLEPGPVVQYKRAVWDDTGRRVVFSGVDKKNSMRVYVQDVAGGPPRAVTAEDVGLGMIGRPVSPDGRQVVAVGPDGVPALYPLAGGEPVPIPGLGDGDLALCWTPESRELMVAHYDLETPLAPPRIDRVEVGSGRTRVWNRLVRAAPSALLAQSRILVTPDGESYAYNDTRALSDLYLVSKLK
jgi:tRNA A-37 threonylcarbamoyl transferase component Bud32